MPITAWQTAASGHDFFEGNSSSGRGAGGGGGQNKKDSNSNNNKKEGEARMKGKRTRGVATVSYSDDEEGQQQQQQQPQEQQRRGRQRDAAAGREKTAGRGDTGSSCRGSSSSSSASSSSSSCPSSCSCPSSSSCASSSPPQSKKKTAKERGKRALERTSLLTKETLLSPGAWCSRLSMTCWNIMPCRRHDEIPTYWANVGKDIRYGLRRGDSEFFDDLYPVDQDERKLLQALINHTSSRKDDVSFRLLRAVRIENSSLWGRYNKRFTKTGAKRGRRKWAGKSPPATVGVFKELGAVNDFTQDLDQNICEAYLWHGCSPLTAVQIGHEGFCVKHQSRAGKRFGEGGYFAEDPGLADKYAGAGEGIYRDCYAMLLCRVILGRQFVTKEFKDESITQRARHLYDSTLAEPRGSTSREFVAFRDDQIYPEYALVYERSFPQTSLRDEKCLAMLKQKDLDTDQEGDEGSDEDSCSTDASGDDVPAAEQALRGGEEKREEKKNEKAEKKKQREQEQQQNTNKQEKQENAALAGDLGVDLGDEEKAILKTYPHYWFHAENHESFHELCPAQHMEEMLQSLLDKTFALRFTQDRIDSLSGRALAHVDDMPRRLRVLKALRIESSALWHDFQHTKLRMRRKFGEGKAAQRIKQVKTHAHLPKVIKSRLATDLNETYLWCGSIPSTIGDITTKGFTDGLFVKERGPFGPGAYFVDDSAHADEFSLDNKEGYYKGYYAMLLCRVLLGQPQYIQKAGDTQAHLRLGAGQPFDSSVGKVAANEKHFREFMVRSPGQIYPEYAIIYEREYRDRRVR